MLARENFKFCLLSIIISALSFQIAYFLAYKNANTSVFVSSSFFSTGRSSLFFAYASGWFSPNNPLLHPHRHLRCHSFSIILACISVNLVKGLFIVRQRLAKPPCVNCESSGPLNRHSMRFSPLHIQRFFRLLSFIFNSLSQHYYLQNAISTAFACFN